jgi:PPIC-type PPIASE domain/SurA N-terminal domain
MLKKKKIFIKVLLALLLILILALIWLYIGPVNNIKLKIFKALPLPMALVNGRPLPMNNFLLRFETEQKIYGQAQAEQDKNNIVNEVIKENEVAQLSAQRDVSVSSSQINNEYSEIASQTNLQGAANFEAYLQNLGLTENIFKNSVIKPQLLLSQLEIWFNSQPKLNPAAYSTANNLLAQINSGTDMASLANQYSQDETGKKVGGDMGFVQITDLSQELRENISNMKVGDTEIIPSINGLNVIRLQQQSGNSVHLRNIFLKTGDFNQWLTGQEKNFVVVNLLKI